MTPTGPCARPHWAPITKQALSFDDQVALPDGHGRWAWATRFYRIGLSLRCVQQVAGGAQTKPD
ncbi:MAG: hypothetical protein BWK72_11625 [Rhodoferax ferrireducens]|uniref:Uncharacterized protein n=1 Tax=Rhodoferax ferrireducens TaxID=192843 RepID=A0A1W9KTW3_9BURK|nr:MAG: hypothetical protein BWK72_11625 [Rhodoferax ferrireducens]